MTHLRASRDNLEAFLAPVGTVKALSDIDGLRVALTDGSTIHFRPSGNAPEMRCYVEAANQDAAETLLNKGSISSAILGDALRDAGLSPGMVPRLSQMSHPVIALLLFPLRRAIRTAGPKEADDERRDHYPL